MFLWEKIKSTGDLNHNKQQSSATFFTPLNIHVAVQSLSVEYSCAYYAPSKNHFKNRTQMQRGHDGGGSTPSRHYPCSAKCVISPNFKHGCFEKVRASHLNVSPDITFIQFASQLRASMVSSHTHPRQPTGVVEIVNSKVLLRRCQILNDFLFFPRHELQATWKDQDISR